MTRLLLLPGILCALGTPSQAAEWPCLRGPSGDGVAPGGSLLARTERVALRTVWVSELGSGCSSVAVADGRAVTLHSEGDSDWASCFDAETGQRLWTVRIGDRYPGQNGAFDGPVSTPLIADGAAYCLHPAGSLYAFELADGRERWSLNLTADLNAAPGFYGFGASPMLVGGKVVLEAGANPLIPGTSADLLVALDPRTGEKAWSAGQDSASYQLPVLGRFGGAERLLVCGDTKMYALEPATGEVVLEYAHEASGGRGMLSLVPVLTGPTDVFLANKDESSRLVSFAAGEGATEWENTAIRNSYSVPVVYDGDLYAYSSRFLTCVDIDSGRAHWKSRSPGDGFLILADGHLMIVTKEGSLHVAKASRDGYQEIASAEVFDDLVWAIPALVGDSIFVRSLDRIARVDLVPSSRPSTLRVAEQTPVGPAFGKMLAEVDAAEDKAGVVDRFLEGIERTPWVEGETVHFLYRGPGTDVAVASDLFGARQERSMTPVAGTDLFYYAVKLPRDVRANYILLVDYDETLDANNPRRARSSVFLKDMELSWLQFGQPTLTMNWFAMPDWTEPTFLPDPETAELAGRVLERSITSESLGEVPMRIYLPPGYDESDNRYPVVYIHDGLIAGTYGDVIETADRLIELGEAEPFIAVEIRWFLNLFVGAGGYDRMIGDEVVPWVDEQFRTKADRQSRLSYGGGLGGFLALVAGLNNPDTFAHVAAQSVYYFEVLQPPLEAGIASTAENKPRIYLEWGRFDVANEDENWDMGERASRLADRLRDAGFSLEGGEVNDTGDWPSWRNRLDRVFGLLEK